MGVSHLFDILETEIRGKNGSLIIFQGLQNHTADSIKSLEGYDIALLVEAQAISQRSIDLLRPTIRKEGSEIWVEWNPETEDVPIDKLLRGKDAPSDRIIVEANHTHNPFFPEVLRKEMEEDKIRDYDKYLHVWEGHYRRTLDGAVYAKEIRALFEQKRVMRVLPIPGKPIETFWDLGKRDHTVIWFAQMQMGEIRILDFYENRGFFLDHYVKVLKEKGYTYGKMYLPHDGNTEKLNAKSIAHDLRQMMPGHTVIVRPRMSRKAMGISAVRKIFSNCYFDEEKTAPGIKRMGQFKFDVDPDTGQYSSAEPEHDENSDAADAFAQLALSLTEKKKPEQTTSYQAQSFWAQ